MITYYDDDDDDDDYNNVNRDEANIEVSSIVKTLLSKDAHLNSVLLYAQLD